MFLFVITEEVSCEFGSSKYYALCGFGGILSCGITHTAVVPLDLVKCRLQVCMETQRSVAGRTQQLQPLQSKLNQTEQMIDESDHPRGKLMDIYPSNCIEQSIIADY